MFRDQNLWEDYKTTRFKWLSSPLKSEQFCIITAYNPRSVVTALRENQQAQVTLIKSLEDQGFCYTNILAGDSCFDYSEPSVAVACDLICGIRLATRFGQNALFWVDQNTLWLEPVLLTGFRREDLGSFLQRLSNS